MKLAGFQEEAVSWLRERGRGALFWPPGYGKTRATLAALRAANALPALVLAPASVVKAKVWSREALVSGYGPGPVLEIAGTPSHRHALLRGGGAVEVISYDNYLWLSNVVDVEERYRGIVFDELSKMKHAGTQRSKRARAKKGGIRIPFRVGLTGSPVGNHLLDLWGEMAVVQPGVLNSFSEYVARYFTPTAYARTPIGLRPVAWDPRPGSQKDIFKRIAKYARHAPAVAAQGIPPVQLNAIRVPAPPAVELALVQLRDELWTQLPSGAELEVAQATSAAQKARQMAGGAVYTKAPAWEEVHDGKLEALADLLTELQGAPALVFYWYGHELERLQKMLKAAGYTVGVGVADIGPWNEGKLDVLLLHPQSAGHGLNLQDGGSTVIWYTLPWSHELYEQGVGRLARRGQKAPVVLSHALLCGAVDEAVLLALDEKGTTQDALFKFLQERSER